MATEYLNYLQDAVESPQVFAQIVLDMVDGALPEGVHGQLVGFLSTIEQRLVVKTTKKRG